MGIRQEIMDLPDDERLPYAIQLLEELTGENVEQRAWLQQNFGLTRTEAKFLLFLNNNFPRVMSKETIFEYVWGDTDTVIKSLDVLLFKLRKKGFKIQTHWGRGLSLEESIEVGEVSDPVELNQRLVWTADNDNDLITMVKSGSNLRAMAYELDRTERAIKERIWKLKRAGKL